MLPGVCLEGAPRGSLPPPDPSAGTAVPPRNLCFALGGTTRAAWALRGHGGLPVRPSGEPGGVSAGPHCHLGCARVPVQSAPSQCLAHVTVNNATVPVKFPFCS